tara:strand:+ start:13498 stop:13911 length:414 start_codon:yes stop_codon:yes gene_type:complete
MPTKAELEVELSLVKNQLSIANTKYDKALQDHSKREKQLTMNLEYICDESNLFWYAISDAYVAAYIEPDSLMSSDDAPEKKLIFKIPCLQGWRDDKNPDEPTFEEKLNKLYDAVKEMSSGWVDQRVVVEKCIRDSNY